ncbi:MAG: glycosyltransferase family 4 protein [Anaerolineae bacterium]|nr:glycosyltransferase family 4 protein [Anaerolineae bacterium]
MATEKKPHVAYVVSMSHGLDAWTFREIDELVEKGLEVSIYPVRYVEGPYMPRDDWFCYRYSRLGVILRQPLHFLRKPGKYLSLLFDALRTKSLIYFLLGADFAHQMSKRGVDFIHSVFGDHKLFVGYYCKQFSGIPLSVAIYGYETQDNPNWAMFHKAVPDCDEIVVNCDYHKKVLGDLVGADVAEKAKVIRHYSDIKEYGDPVKVLIVGGFQERKGHDILLQAVGRLRGEVDIEVWAAGYPGVVDVGQLSRDYGIEDKVVVFGEVSDQVLDFLYRSCDVFCLPFVTDDRGINEGLPVSLIEAMSYGKPVIATRLTGTPELVEEILIDERDVDGLADALRRYGSDPALRNKAGERSIEIVQTDYSKNNAQKTYGLFVEAINKQKEKQKETTNN